MTEAQRELDYVKRLIKALILEGDWVTTLEPKFEIIEKALTQHQASQNRRDHRW